MSYLTSVAGVLLFALLSAEAIGRAKQLARWIINMAVRRLPAAYKSRFEEEWLAHLADCPGPIAQLSHALGCDLSSRRRRPFDMSLVVAFRFRALETFGRFIRAYGAYCRAKTAGIFIMAWVYKLIGAANAGDRMFRSAAELYRMSLIIDRAGSFAQITQKFAYIRGAESDLSKNLKTVFVRYALSSTCFYLRAMFKNERHVYVLRNCVGASSKMPKRDIGPLLSTLADERASLQREMGLLRGYMSEIERKAGESLCRS